MQAGPPGLGKRAPGGFERRQIEFLFGIGGAQSNAECRDDACGGVRRITQNDVIAIGIEVIALQPLARQTSGDRTTGARNRAQFLDEDSMSQASGLPDRIGIAGDGQGQSGLHDRLIRPRPAHAQAAKSRLRAGADDRA